MLLAIFTLQFHFIQRVLHFFPSKFLIIFLFPIQHWIYIIKKECVPATQLCQRRHKNGDKWMQNNKYHEKKLVTALFTYSHRVECHQIRRICDIIWNFLCFYMLPCGFLLSQSCEFVCVRAFCAHDGNEPTSKQCTNTMIKRYVY